jgi:ABC-2 type transport system permease protein
MYLAVRGSNGVVAQDFLPFLYISSACFMLVAGITSGMSHAVVTDRESYGMLKFIRISPVRLRTYLIGRGLSRGAQASVGALLTVGVGLAVFPELRAALDERGIAWGWLLLYLVMGSALMVSLGLILAGAVLNMARYGMFLSDGVAGALYLLSGAVFPIDLLPNWLRPISFALPPTYWLEGMRRALIGPSALRSPLSHWEHVHLAAALLSSTLVLMALAHVFFRWSEARAWHLGRFEETSGI